MASHIIAPFLTLTIFLFTCTQLSAHERLHSKIKKARKSFSFIKVKITIKPLRCHYVEKKNGKNTKKKCDISKLPPKTLNTFGSGIVVKHVINSTYVLTAAHVCSHKDIDEKTVGHKKITVSLTPEISIKDVQGNEYPSQIYAIDAKNDLCILKAEGVFGSPAPIASKMPPTPSRVYAYEAPLAINHPNMVLLYSGFTGGPHYEYLLERTTYFYTLVARPGSSGSGILNEEGQVVGIIHTAVTNLQNVSIGATLESIQKITDSIPNVVYKRVNQ